MEFPLSVRTLEDIYVPYLKERIKVPYMYCHPWYPFTVHKITRDNLMGLRRLKKGHCKLKVHAQLAQHKYSCFEKHGYTLEVTD